MERNCTSTEQEREKMYSMAVTLEMEEMADYEEAAIRKDRREHWDLYMKMSHKELIRRINKVADQAEKEWKAMQKNKKSDRGSDN